MCIGSGEFIRHHSRLLFGFIGPRSHDPAFRVRLEVRVRDTVSVRVKASVRLRGRMRRRIRVRVNVRRR